ncbi:uncharacterized protein SPAPADRAFT_56517 [Spathaspora passalidarum NRRL Y-27907]|uniref:Peptidase S8/S53 domain-containing protein n=1 Tax=Spathaspora passalidarum (strain NRRL Y-27907 / 11-Y1) TaxID=619300 RepID=G3ARC5_SPAPN|nr:uncharacterized protein SPAPADRAFT_56517 [Spathaspora passalidarum NRRL Y-27907]EGW31732.1 hypothetical protein SPAPADRAFT_56517 [Spathaspora passalidarum NRRL Y-27907]
MPVKVCYDCIEMFRNVDPYLVSLQSDQSLESFFAYDLQYPPTKRVRDLVTETFTFGDFNAFAGNFPKDILKRLKRCKLVADVTPDVIFQAFDIRAQNEAPRHLARISRIRRMNPGKQYSYLYDSSFSGQQVNAYVIDSGVRIDHPEFSGRAQIGKDFTNEGPGDNNGHGTHVAGLIGSSSYGVAKHVELIEIKALNSKGAGTLSSILAAIEFAAKHREQTGRMGVANLSLGAFKNACLNRAIEKATNTGLIIVVAAGNTGTDACLTSPASSPHAITVGAINDYDDSLAEFSNWGPCVDIFASGSDVRSVNAQDFETSQVLSGTSMAAPIVSGVVASLLSEGIKSQDIKQTLIMRANKDRIPKASISFRKDTPNRIVYNGLSLDKESEQDK